VGHGRQFDRDFSDEGVSRTIPAANRPGFSSMLNYVREGNCIHV
jgi:putative DNA-invertase from lambdoid prophage Rac